MQRQILEVMLHADKPLDGEEISLQLAVRRDIDVDVSLLREELMTMQEKRLVAVRRDGTYSVTGVARKLMGKTPCNRRR